MSCLCRLVPDHMTIADFRKDNGAAIRKVCAHFIALCRTMGLLTQRGSRRVALRISRTVFSALSGTRLLACLIVAPRQGYDEPGFLSYTIRPFCPTSADGLQPRHMIIAKHFTPFALENHPAV
jgi:hypothetical protein